MKRRNFVKNEQTEGGERGAAKFDILHPAARHKEI